VRYRAPVPKENFMHSRRLALVIVTGALACGLTSVAACGSGSSGNAGVQDSGVGSGDGNNMDTGTGMQDSTPGDTGGDAGADGPVKRTPFPVVVNGGDPQMTSPKVVTITFLGDTMASQLATFGQGVTQSAWWSQVIADYCQADGGPCVGQTGVAAPQTTAAAASYTDSASGGPSTLQTALQDLIATSAVPAPDANTLYLFYFPSTTTVTLDGSPTCGSIDGYHGQTSATADGGLPVIYAVAAECQGYMLSDVTLTATHEIAEAVTDGFTGSSGNGGWYLDMSDPNSFGWNDVAGGEVGDLCVDLFNLGGDHTPEGTFTAQRIWSVSKAAAAKNPCVPVPSGEVYFNVSPEKALFIMDVGQTRSFNATAFADGTLPSWTLTPQDWTDPNMAYLQLSVAGGAADGGVSVSDGTIVTVTMKLLADPTGSANGEADGALVSTDTPDPNNATKDHYWPFVVLTSAAAADAGVTEPMHRGPVRRGRGRLAAR
jgi:hypothetical protein